MEQWNNGTMEQWNNAQKRFFVQGSDTTEVAMKTTAG